MIPPQYQLAAKFGAVALVLGLTWLGGYHYRDLVADRDASSAKLQTFVNFGKAINDRDKKFAETQAKLTALETSYTKDLNDALSANSALRADLGVAQRMRLKGTHCPVRGTAPGAASAGGADGVPVELSEATRRAVFDLRAEIIRDQQVIAGLQAELKAREGVCYGTPPPDQG